MSEASLHKRAVAIGGGTGLPTVLGCLLDLGYETTAVVTMADDGGSSGALRRELGMLPPGDIRNCLVAMARDSQGTAAALFQYRFPNGEGLAGHALGNLVIAALADIAGNFPEAIEVAGRLLEVRGTVLPSTLADVALHGVDRAGVEVIGQASLAASTAPVAAAYLEPADPPAYGPALEAIESADLIVVGPGSLYTSLIPNFLVSGMSDAMRSSAALRVYVCNVANMRGETLGLDAAEHVEALLDHGLADAIDVVLVHQPSNRPCPDEVSRAGERADEYLEPVVATAAVVAEIEALGVRVVAQDLADACDLARHDRARLCQALREVTG